MTMVADIPQSIARPATTCVHCGHPLRPSHARAAQHPGTRAHSGRGLCTVCVKDHRDEYDLRPSTADLLDDAEHLLSFGIDPLEIARRLDRTPTALARAAYRQGRASLGSTFERAARTR